MENKLLGRVHEVRPTQTIQTKSGQPFLKRELVLDCARYDSLTGERGFDNFPCLTFVQEKCALLDTLAPGMAVAVSFDVTGRKAPDSDRYYNDLRGYKVEEIRKQGAVLPETQPIPQPSAPLAPEPTPEPAPEANDGLPF